MKGRRRVEKGEPSWESESAARGGGADGRRGSLGFCFARWERASVGGGLSGFSFRFSK